MPSTAAERAGTDNIGQERRCRGPTSAAPNGAYRWGGASGGWGLTPPNPRRLRRRLAPFWKIPDNPDNLSLFGLFRPDKNQPLALV